MTAWLHACLAFYWLRFRYVFVRAEGPARVRRLAVLVKRYAQSTLRLYGVRILVDGEERLAGMHAPLVAARDRDWLMEIAILAVLPFPTALADHTWPRRSRWLHWCSSPVVRDLSSAPMLLSFSLPDAGESGATSVSVAGTSSLLRDESVYPGTVLLSIDDDVARSRGAWNAHQEQVTIRCAEFQVPASRLRSFGTMFVTMLTFGALAASMTPLLLLSWGRLRKFCIAQIVAPGCRMLLALHRTPVSVDPAIELCIEALKRESKVGAIVFNHASSVDLVVLGQARFFGARPFMSVMTWPILPLTWVNLCINTWLLPMKKNESARKRSFAAAASALRTSAQWGLLSAEGVHRFGPSIAPFQDEVFALASALGGDVVGVYIGVPYRQNPWYGFDIKPGPLALQLVGVWRVKNAEATTVHNAAEEARAAFVEHHRSYQRDASRHSLLSD